MSTKTKSSDSVLATFACLSCMTSGVLIGLNNPQLRAIAPWLHGISVGGFAISWFLAEQTPGSKDVQLKSVVEPQQQLSDVDREMIRAIEATNLSREEVMGILKAVAPTILD